MKMKIVESEYQGIKFKQLYIVLEDGTEYLVGTLKDKQILRDGKILNIHYINCVHKEFKKN